MAQRSTRMATHCAPIRRSTFSAPTAAMRSTTIAAPASCASMPWARRWCTGTSRPGKISQDVVGGGSLFHRSVDLSPTIVYTPLGVENIYQPDIAYAPENPYQQAGPATLADFNHQVSGIVQDRVHLPGGVTAACGRTLCAGQRFQLCDYRARCGFRNMPQATRLCRISRSTATMACCFRLGRRRRGGWIMRISFWIRFFTRQAEVGVKYETSDSADRGSYFQMRQPFFYPRVIQAADDFCTSNLSTGGDVAPGDLCFESDGHETHDGVELSAQGKGGRTGCN